MKMMSHGIWLMIWKGFVFLCDEFFLCVLPSFFQKMTANSSSSSSSSLLPFLLLALEIPTSTTKRFSKDQRFDLYIKNASGNEFSWHKQRILLIFFRWLIIVAGTCQRVWQFCWHFARIAFLFWRSGLSLNESVWLLLLVRGHCYHPCLKKSLMKCWKMFSSVLLFSSKRASASSSRPWRAIPYQRRSKEEEVGLTATDDNLWASVWFFADSTITSSSSSSLCISVNF